MYWLPFHQFIALPPVHCTQGVAGWDAVWFSGTKHALLSTDW